MEKEIVDKLKKIFEYDLDKVLKNYMKKSANEVKNKYKAEMNIEDRPKIINFIDGVTELMSNDINKLIRDYLNEFENNL